MSIDPKTEAEGQKLIQNLLDSKIEEPIFAIFDKDKVASAMAIGFKSELLPNMMPVNGVQTSLYSFNHWLKTYKINIVEHF